MSAELTRKDMKEPDQFQVAAGEAASWLKGHRRTALVLGSVTAVVLVVALVVSGVSERRAAAAGALLADVYRAAGGEISSVPLPGVPGPIFPDDAARQRAVIEAAGKLLAEYPGSPSAAPAALAKGDAQLRLGEWDAATASYQAYLGAADKGDAFRFGALEGLALAAEGKGNTEGALAGWARLAAEIPAQADRADLAKARLLAASGKVAEARQLLDGFAEGHKGSPLVPEAAELLSRLGGK